VLSVFAEHFPSSARNTRSLLCLFMSARGTPFEPGTMWSSLKGPLLGRTADVEPIREPAAEPVGSRKGLLCSVTMLHEGDFTSST
jgi:hypothetical protein